MSETGIPSEAERKRPGGPLFQKPHQKDDGGWVHMGEEISEQKAKDISYSMDFWRGKNDPKFERDLREAMIGSLKTAFENQRLSIFVSPEGITERDKEKISAYRVLAEEVGYKIGKFSFNKDAHVASGPIEKIKPSQG